MTSSLLPLATGEKPAVERADGIEPTIPLWKRGVLPLNYARVAWGKFLGCVGLVKPAARGKNLVLRGNRIGEADHGEISLQQSVH
jgi:hypothetical protein